MYLAAGLVGVVYVILGFLSGKETVEFENIKVSRVEHPFYRIAIYLYKWACIYKVPFLSNKQVEKDLEKLYPAERKKQISTEYYVSKLAKALMICLVGTLLGLVVSVQAKGNSILGDEGAIVRGTYEEGAKEVEVEAALPEGVQEFTIEVAAKIFSEEEIERLYDAFCAELPEYILGENPSLQEVYGKLNLQEMYEGYPFTVEWVSSNPDIIHSDGTLGNVEEVLEAELCATIWYEEWKWEECLSIRIVPPELSQEEWIHWELEKMLLASEESSRTQEEWQLPDNWEGQELSWTQKEEDLGPILWVGGFVVAVLVYLLADKDLHDEVEKRKLQMKKNYPDVVHKLVLYLGAGTTIRGAFQRMAEEYTQARREGKTECPIYEEILHTCRELEAGVSEGVSYEHFGRRTGLQEYIRLTTLLTQNLKKGNSTLLQRLREEAEKASAERIQYGKRLGEEAVTKLLLPMVMMLLVVMLMIMIPAFSSVGT